MRNIFFSFEALMLLITFGWKNYFIYLFADWFLDKVGNSISPSMKNSLPDDKFLHWKILPRYLKLAIFAELIL